MAALGALAALATPSEGAALLAALGAEADSVRWAAALALGARGSPALAPTLLDRVEQGAAVDRAVTLLALSGMADRGLAPAVLARLERGVARHRGVPGEPWLEVLGRGPGTWGRVRRWRDDPDPARRAKLAELGALHAEAAADLARLAGDRAPAVRAAALWALGAVARPADLALLERAVADATPMAAAAAVGALGRAHARLGRPLPAVSCGALAHRAPLVRAAALGALGHARAACAAGIVERVLAEDGDATVRRLAARALHAGVASPGAAAARALVRCAELDPDPAVAGACASPAVAPAAAAGPRAVLVFVVGAGTAAAAPGSAFALLRGDHLVRPGHADGRGALLEAAPGAGALELLPL